MRTSIEVGVTIGTIIESVIGSYVQFEEIHSIFTREDPPMEASVFFKDPIVDPHPPLRSPPCPFSAL
ncbi:hypothetical protein EVAR_59078_1 [Eumeta japonica]|uniref:Uncharacterized protein n=1 Tax=Eumeta variegata TaxID=151549 RepID=A0A4C1YW83_EUMVA|nr:hypothetical protein EVAR_59078_1 [Eumeta japonica]